MVGLDSSQKNKGRKIKSSLFVRVKKIFSCKYPYFIPLSTPLLDLSTFWAVSFFHWIFSSTFFICLIINSNKNFPLHFFLPTNLHFEVFCKKKKNWKQLLIFEAHHFPRGGRPLTDRYFVFFSKTSSNNFLTWYFCSQTLFFCPHFVDKKALSIWKSRKDDNSSQKNYGLRLFPSG